MKSNYTAKSAEMKTTAQRILKNKKDISCSSIWKSNYVEMPAFGSKRYSQTAIAV